MTQDQATTIINSSTRCTEATLKAFGIAGYPTQGSGCLEFLTRAEYRLTSILLKGRVSMKNMEYQLSNQKNYLINTDKHAMACIKGVLVDTMREGWNKRRVLFAWEVSKRIENETLYCDGC